MKIIKWIRSENSVVVLPASLDDLWVLSKVVEPRDLVSGLSTRKVRIGSETEKARVERRQVFVKLEVDVVDLDFVAGALRVRGRIKEGPEDLPYNSMHTLALEQGFEVRIQKEKWKKYQIERLEAAAKKGAAAKILVCCLDDEVASFAAVSETGIRKLGDVELALAKKSYLKGAEVEKEQYGKIISRLSGLNKELQPNKIVVASPAFWKDELLKRLKQKDEKLASIVLAESVSNGGFAGIKELLNRGVIEKVEKESRLNKEFELVNALKVAVAKKGLAAYGFDAVRSAAEAGSVSVLLVTEDFLKRAREKGTYLEAAALIDLVEENGGVVYILGESEASDELDGLGGVGALMRFKID